MGNAVTVPVAKWIGYRLVHPGNPVDVERRLFEGLRGWPCAAASMDGLRQAWIVTERPLRLTARTSLASILHRYGAAPLSLGATRGFATRLKASSLIVAGTL